MRLLNFTLQKGTLEAEPSEVFLATPVASASDYNHMPDSCFLSLN